MEEFTYLENHRLGKPKTPSKWIGKPEYLPITKIRMTCGGGMGGSTWYEYVQHLDKIPSNEIISVRRYDGKDIRLNTSYIVEAEDFTMATVHLDISEWAKLSASYRGSNIETYYVLIDGDQKLELL